MPGIDYSTFTGWATRPATVLDPLREDLNCDVVVVGGGLGGMETARRLASRGLDVVLLEAAFCGFGASSRNAGQLSGKPSGEPQVLDRKSPDRLRNLVSFSEGAVRHIEGMIAELGIDCEYEPTGNVGVAVTERQFRKARADAAALARAGANVQFGDHRELGVPGTFRGGILTRTGGTMNPGRFTLGVRDALIASPVRVFENTPALEVTDGPGGAVVKTPQGRVRAECVVIASNAYAPELAAVPTALATPIWVTMIETEPVDADRITEAGWTSRSGLASKHNVMESFHVTPDGAIACGVRRLELGSHPLDDRAPTPWQVNDLTRGFHARFPSLCDVRVTDTWGGWIAMTASHTPIAGRASEHVYYFIGCNGHGLGQAPHLGGQLADHLAGDEMTDDVRMFWQSSNDFKRSPLLRTTVLNAGWLADRIEDRLSIRQQFRRGA